MTDEDLNLDVIEALDFDGRVPCAGKKGKCDEEPVWYGALGCCGYTDVYCNTCRHTFDFYIEALSIYHHGVPTACEQRISSISWSPL